MKKGLVFFVFALIALNVSAQERDRGFYFDFGLGSDFGFGPKGINYNEALSNVKEIASNNGYTRIPFYIDITAGWVLLQNLYVVGTMYGMGDFMFKNSESVEGLMIGFRTYGAGVRYYPLDRYLQIGADIGLSTTVFVASESWNNVQTECGFGTKLLMAYDFNKNMTGHSFALGSVFMVNFLKDDVISAVSIFAKYVFK